MGKKAMRVCSGEFSGWFVGPKEAIVPNDPESDVAKWIVGTGFYLFPSPKYAFLFGEPRATQMLAEMIEKVGATIELVSQAAVPEATLHG
jgi:hypothetical protein